MLENTTENKSKYLCMMMCNGQEFVLTKDSYYDESKSGMGIVVKEEGFLFKFDWEDTENAMRYGNGVFPYSFFNRVAAVLTPLSQITDEHAVEVGIIVGYNPIRSNIVDVGRAIALNEAFSGNRDKMINVLDFLRSKGYLLPWMGLSTEELISRGWAKEREVER